MNDSVKELLSIIKDYIESLEYKNEQGLTGDIHIDIIQKAVEGLYNVDISIHAGVEAKENADETEQDKVKKEIEELKETIKNDPKNEKAKARLLQIQPQVNEVESSEKEVGQDELRKELAELKETVKNDPKNERAKERMLQIMPQVNEVEIESSILELYEATLNEYASANLQASITEDGFAQSSQLETFRTNVLSILGLGLKNETITSNQCDKILSDYKITASESELNKILSEDIPPKPTDVPPEGQKYTWDAKNKMWVLTSIV